MNQSGYRAVVRMAIVVAAACLCAGASAQTPAPSAPPAPAAAPAAPAGARGDAPASAAQGSGSSPLEQLSWLRGCWSGKVERREFMETWLPPRGGMMVGISQTIVQEPRRGTGPRTQDYEYLRLEARPDGVYYVVVPSGEKETTFKLGTVGDTMGRTTYPFANLRDEFPQRIVYMRGSDGWLYAQVTGKVGNDSKEVTYPMQHVDCRTGAALRE
ncbi:MAG TPA: DUF6265 family protein [Casimicrobiaceae bacterium]